MGLFLVERYVPAMTGDTLAARAAKTARAAERLSAAHGVVRYVWSAFVPSEETCLCLFEAPDRAAVERVNRGAGFDFDRIVEVIDVLDGPDETI